MKSSMMATGFRSISAMDGCAYSREPASIGAIRYPWIVEDTVRLPVKQAIIDAECCCADEDGLTDFDALHSRVNDDLAFAYAFDLLLLDGEDMRRAPLTERKARLTKLLRKARPGIRLSEHIEADGVIVFAHACKLGLEGIVSKRVDAPYRSGRGRTWIKVKNKNAPAFMRVQEGTFQSVHGLRS